MKKLSESAPLDVLLRSALYEEFAFDDGLEGCEQVYRVLFFSEKIDWMCPGCKKETTHIGTPNYPEDSKDTSIYSKRKLSYFKIFAEQYDLGYFYTKNIFCVPIRCLRGDSYSSDHLIEVQFKVEKNRLIKIGQFPSATTIEQFQNVKYRKVLGNRYGEFNKAIGLFNFNIGIGSFVYLRRIFEDLIHEAASAHPDLLPSDFETTRMDKRILALKSVLPSYLVENRKIYSILSKGIHELSEEQCLVSFPVMKLGIELILDEKHGQMVREEKTKANSKALDALHAEFGDE